MNRPNILWIMSEDFPPRTGAYGDPLARTPNLDALATDGVLFENAFCTTPVCAPSRFSVITGMYPWSLAPGQHMQAEAKVPSDIPTYPELLREAGYYVVNNVKTHYNSDIDEHRIWHDCSPTAHWRNRPTSETPFFAAFMPQSTHESALFREHVEAVSPSEVAVPPYLPDTEEVRDDIARYYSAITKLDSEVGELLAQLREDALLESTVIIWTSDHGGVLPRTKRFVYDEGLQIPLVLHVPERWQALCPWQPGETVSTAVGQIDLTPTVLTLAGAHVPAHMPGRALLGTQSPEPPGVVFGGRDRMDERWDLMRTARDDRFRYIRNYAPDLPWGQHYAFPWLAKSWQSWEVEHIAGRLNPTQEAFWHPKPAEELYDTKADPHEIANLIDDPALSETADRLRLLLDEHMISVNDNGFIPEGSSLEGWHESRGEDAYPLRDVMALSAAAIHRDPAGIPALVAALDHRSEVMRFWGARGLVMLREKAKPASPAIARACTDASPRVRAVAAWAGLWVDEPTAAATLIDLLADDEPWQVQLQSLNALTYAPRPMVEALDRVEQLAEDDQQYVRGAARYLRLVLRGEYTPDAKNVFDFARFMSQGAGSHRPG